MINEKKLIEWIHQAVNDGQYDEYKPAAVLCEIWDMIKELPKVGEWIPCSERLPEEHGTMFAKFKNTEHWRNGMFEKCSNDVNVTVEFEDGTRATKTTHTTDGEWKLDRYPRQKVIAWQSLPNPWEGEK